jgi:hypothetical protein
MEVPIENRQSLVFFVSVKVSDNGPKGKGLLERPGSFGWCLSFAGPFTTLVHPAHPRT